MTKNRKSQEFYFNRELSWLEFNDRVLREGMNDSVPLLERLKFLSIVSTNLDEFFMVRVAGLRQQQAAKVHRRDRNGMTVSGQLKVIHQRVRAMVVDHTLAVEDVFRMLREHGIRILSPREWSLEDQRFIRDYFHREIQPILTPIAAQNADSLPLLPNLQTHIGAVLEIAEHGVGSPSMVLLPVPSALAKFVPLPGYPAGHYARLDEIVLFNLDQFFSFSRIISSAVFRITRDADAAIQDDDAADLLESVSRMILDRRRRDAVRLEITAFRNKAIRQWLQSVLGLESEHVYEIPEFLDGPALMDLAQKRGWENLRDPSWPAQIPRDLLGEEDLWQAVRDHDVLMFHPYESFDPVVQLLQLAAADPKVMAIKQTLYRTSGDSPVVKALQQAAENGKQVTVLVELKARFDEARNIRWARRLEDAGCLVIYGIAGHKTHSKALLIVRRENNSFRRYVHLATGNYNDRTARLYTDFGLLTGSNSIATDVSSFFNLLTGYSESAGWSELTIAPTDLRRRFIELIEREIQSGTTEQPGRIMAKVNSLEDTKIIDSLYRAGQAGVRIQLNVRGICCLRPGVKKLSENIVVRSIVDRYLEHPRIFYFQNAGHDEVYLSSADWMTRNLDKRLEILFPIKDVKLRRRLIGILETYFLDNSKAWLLLPNGQYEKVKESKPAVRAQETFYREAVETARTWEKEQIKFRPLKRSETE
jgi:polyphosphate kinase